VRLVEVDRVDLGRLRREIGQRVASPDEMVTMVEPSGNCSAARSASGSSQIWCRPDGETKMRKAVPNGRFGFVLLLRTASAMSCVFIHSSNQQFDEGIAPHCSFATAGKPHDSANFR